MVLAFDFKEKPIPDEPDLEHGGKNDGSGNDAEHNEKSQPEANAYEVD